MADAVAHQSLTIEQQSLAVNNARRRQQMENDILELPSSNWDAFRMDRIHTCITTVLDDVSTCLDLLMTKLFSSTQAVDTVTSRNEFRYKKSVFAVHSKFRHRSWELASCHNYLVLSEQTDPWEENNAYKDPQKVRIYEALRIHSHPDSEYESEFELALELILAYLKAHRLVKIKGPPGTNTENPRVPDIQLYRIITDAKKSFFYRNTGKLRRLADPEGSRGLPLQQPINDDQCCAKRKEDNLLEITRKLINKHTALNWMHSRMLSSKKSVASEEEKLVTYLNSQDTGADLPIMKTRRMWAGSDGCISAVPLEFLRPDCFTKDEFTDSRSRRFHDLQVSGGLYDYRRILYVVIPPVSDGFDVTINGSFSPLRFKSDFGLSKVNFAIVADGRQQQTQLHRLQLPYLFGRYTASAAGWLCLSQRRRLHDGVRTQPHVQEGYDGPMQVSHAATHRGGVQLPRQGRRRS